MLPTVSLAFSNIISDTDSNLSPAIRRKFSAFTQLAADYDVLEAYALKPLLDGKALAKALDTPPGPWMKDALDVVMAYQLHYPTKANEGRRNRRGTGTSAPKERR